LEESIRFDCSYEHPMPTRMGGAAWRQGQIEAALRKIESSSKYRREEIERVQARNDYLRVLRAAL
jgi:hypothetical protein